MNNLNCKMQAHARVCEGNILESRQAVVSRKAKKKQQARAYSSQIATTTMSYLHGWSV